MSVIFITEKPSVAREFEKILKVNSTSKTDGYIEGQSSVMKSNVIITWAVGHLIAISAPEVQNEAWSGKWSKDKLPMIPQEFKYEPQKATYKQFKIVKSLYTRKDITAIYYAGDSAREGVYIQALIRNQIFKSTPKIDEKIVWMDDQTEEKVLKAIKEAKPYSHYQPMVDSGYARAIADWLIGMNFTEAFTLTSGNGKLINTGRVMTPTLAMIVERQKEIDSFTKKYSYGVKANENINWKAVKGSKYFESNLLYSENGFEKERDASKLIEELNLDKKLKVNEVKTQTKTEYAPFLFNLADLQAYCAKVFKISPSKTLEYTQSLYEKKFVSYPRTDSRYLTTGVAIEFERKGYAIPKRYVDDSKVKDHYAIVPTFHGNASSLSGKESDVYKTILKRFLDIMKPPFIYEAISIGYIHSNKEMFFESFRLVKQLGFKEYLQDDDVTDKVVPKKGEVISANFAIRNLETKPPVSYTTGTLISAMEKAGKFIEDEELREQIKTCGIGTSATRASIIDKLKEKEFITIDDKQKISPTEFGKKVIPIIAKYDEGLVSPIKTAELEEKLNDIAEGKIKLSDNLEELKKYIEETTMKIISSNSERIGTPTSSSGKSFNCPCCENVLKFGKFGWYCDCKFSLGLEICGHKMKESDLESLIEKGTTKELSFKSPKTGKEFKAKLVLNKETKKTYFKFDNTKEKSNNTSASNSNKSANTTSKKTTAAEKTKDTSSQKKKSIWDK